MQGNIDNTIDENSELTDCWNHIGVWSATTPSCEKLKIHIHCNNCGLFSKSGRRLLDRAGDREYLNSWIDEVSAPVKKISAKTISIVVFRIGDEWYGLPTSLFHEIVEMRSSHSIPHVKGNVLKGVINIRGELCIYISLGWLIGAGRGKSALEESSKHKYSRIVLVKHETGKYAFPVSEVAGVARYSMEETASVPSTAYNSPANYMSHILIASGRHIGCLNQELIFSAVERALK